MNSGNSMCNTEPCLPLLSHPPSGLLVSHRGEVCRHAEGQGAAAPAAAAGSADAAAQQRHHLGESDRAGRPHPAVSGCKRTRHVAHPLLQPRSQRIRRRRSQCHPPRPPLPSLPSPTAAPPSTPPERVRPPFPPLFPP